MTRQADPVGTVEIAQRLGVTRSAVDQWRRKDFPHPRWTVGGRPAWNWDDVQAWNDKRNRCRAVEPTEGNVTCDLPTGHDDSHSGRWQGNGRWSWAQA